ncbi:DUF6869 domain-containing protein [Montanilutibacter psychrotolerans]|uniref:DUF6869 domain-containing protein n=1 Tax=Montanilutibacter psychrotolerans TaxID=1327343 RepID=A0A3M8SYB4_9GAMM|nr:hypothetical protein [Lysobacter psychrotolerans]RNF86408.1 hypothetical protein EER27_03045 [Lysobacter psychrotolerans]
MTSQEAEAWACAYIAYHEESGSPEQHPLWWAVERFMLPTSGADAEDCWTAIRAVLSRNPADSILGMLAAGPLEDLVQHAGPQFIDRIELEARRNPAFRHLLGGVWESSTPDVWARISAARGGTW